mgnify:CR=1 FL=1|jgi:hypothetical protein
MTTEPLNKDTEASLKPNGAFLAAALSAGIGCFVIGLLIVLALVSPTIKGLLNWWSPAGPLTGKSGVGVIVWIFCWGFLHSRWKEKDQDFQKIWWLALFFIVGGFLMTFPPIFEALAGH